MLTKAQIDEYNEIGAIVVPDVLSADEVQRLRRVTDEFVERARGVTAHNEIYDLEDSHTPDNPRVRRIKAAHLHHPEYARLVRHPKILAVLQDLWGPDIRFDTAKLNMKCAGFGAPVEWHQDWAFYPHTNDDLAAVGVMFDDMEMANGPLMIVPGSHRGPIHDHHADGMFCGAMDPANRDVDYAGAVPLTGRAGSITVHHVRAVHGSAPNVSDNDRRLLLFQFRTADAWPLLGFPAGIEKFKELMVCGVPSRAAARARAGAAAAAAGQTARLALREPEGHEEPLLRGADRSAAARVGEMNDAVPVAPPVVDSTFDITRPLFAEGPPDPVVYDGSERAMRQRTVNFAAKRFADMLYVSGLDRSTAERHFRWRALGLPGGLAARPDRDCGQCGVERGTSRRAPDDRDQRCGSPRHGAVERSGVRFTSHRLGDRASRLRRHPARRTYGSRLRSRADRASNQPDCCLAMRRCR